MLNSIYEERTRLNNGYHIALTIPKDEYVIVYGNNVSESNAQEILNNYLQHRDDDGEAYNIKIYDHDISNMIEIEANLNYIGNKHTEYEKRDSVLARFDNKDI